MKRLLLILWRTSKIDLRLAWFALRHPARPVWLVPALGLLGLYAISPFSYVVPLVLHALLKLLPEPIRVAESRSNLA